MMNMTDENVGPLRSCQANGKLVMKTNEYYSIENSMLFMSFNRTDDAFVQKHTPEFLMQNAHIFISTTWFMEYRVLLSGYLEHSRLPRKYFPLFFAQLFKSSNMFPTKSTQRSCSHGHIEWLLHKKQTSLGNYCRAPQSRRNDVECWFHFQEVRRSESEPQTNSLTCLITWLLCYKVANGKPTYTHTRSLTRWMRRELLPDQRSRNRIIRRCRIVCAEPFGNGIAAGCASKTI